MNKTYEDPLNNLWLLPIVVAIADLLPHHCLTDFI